MPLLWFRAVHCARSCLLGLLLLLSQVFWERSRCGCAIGVIVVIPGLRSLAAVEAPVVEDMSFAGPLWVSCWLWAREAGERPFHLVNKMLGVAGVKDF